MTENFRLDLQKYKALFLLATGIMVLLMASPMLQRVLVIPQTEFFTEMWLLGPEHLAENYPYNITRGNTYSIFLGISNHLGSSAYYVVQVKFRNQTQSAPDSLEHKSSILSSLYNMTVFVTDGENWESPLDFAFDYDIQNVTRTVLVNVTMPQMAGKNGTFVQQEKNITVLQANFCCLTLNDVTLSLGGYSSDWNSTTQTFFGNLIFELWIYNSAISNFQYHERYVDMKLNMTN